MFGLDMIYYQLILTGVFVVASVIGYMLIKNVPGLLHTPLMSGMNALSGVTVLGAIIAASFSPNWLASVFAVAAIAMAAVNIVGGFGVTGRMLTMIIKSTDKKEKILNYVIMIVALLIIAVFCCFDYYGQYKEYVYLGFAILLSVIVLIGIALMSKVRLSRLGNKLNAVAMLLAIVLTLMYNNIFSIWILYLGLLLGAAAGFCLAKKTEMIKMPQMVALLNGLGGAASAVVGAFAMLGIGAGFGYFEKITASIALSIGMITLTGSLIAAGKLNKNIPQKAIVLKGHNFIQNILIILIIALIVLFAVFGSDNNMITNGIILGLLAVLSAIFGIVFAIRVGGADMPITISLLNSLSGVAGAIAGLAIGDLLLVSIGGIVGASGLFLTQIMCKAMNRNLGNILMGNSQNKDTEHPNKDTEHPNKDTENQNKDVQNSDNSLNQLEQDSSVAESKIKDIITDSEDKVNDAEILKKYKNVIIVPGYGMAVAQAQQLVKELADKLVNSGVTVKYAVHPVAGRMPGHMNVLLCEANVDYEDLYEMEDINKDFETADAVIVVGANDVLNPAANTAEGTPIYGMPILDVAKCKEIYIFNYDNKPGYAGVENPIYKRTNGVHIYFGNAAETLKVFLEKMDK